MREGKKQRTESIFSMTMAVTITIHESNYLGNCRPLHVSVLGHLLLMQCIQEPSVASQTYSYSSLNVQWSEVVLGHLGSAYAHITRCSNAPSLYYKMIMF